jgi:hypothetical protein
MSQGMSLKDLRSAPRETAPRREGRGVAVVPICVDVLPAVLGWPEHVAVVGGRFTSADQVLELYIEGEGLPPALPGGERVRARAIYEAIADASPAALRARFVKFDV